MKLAHAAVGALVAILGFIVWLRFHDRAVRAEAQRVAHDGAVDSLVRVEQQRTHVDSLRFERQRDSTGRVIQNLQRRIREVRPTETRGQMAQAGGMGTNQPPVGPVASGASASACAGAPAQCDTLIASLLSGRQQDSLQLLFWKAQVSQRDSVISTLQASRNAWRSRSERRWFCVGGASATIGLNGHAALGPGATCGYRF